MVDILKSESFVPNCDMVNQDPSDEGEWVSECDMEDMQEWSDDESERLFDDKSEQFIISIERNISRILIEKYISKGLADNNMLKGMLWMISDGLDYMMVPYFSSMTVEEMRAIIPNSQHFDISTKSQIGLESTIRLLLEISKCGYGYGVVCNRVTNFLIFRIILENFKICLDDRNFFKAFVAKITEYSLFGEEWAIQLLESISIFCHLWAPTFI